MKLESLVGIHYLDGVDFSTSKVFQHGLLHENCVICKFRINGIVYSATENPDDGYRSYMQELSADAAEEIHNSFPPVAVCAEHEGGENDILRLIDIITGVAVLEVGTNHKEFRYPFAVARFDPRAIHYNRGIYV